MIGITLTADQIRNAPSQVRQWIESQIGRELGLTLMPPAAPLRQIAHLVACTPEDIEGILGRIEQALPAVNVLFEFSRPAISYGEPPVMAFRLLDIMYHARLQNVGQVTDCLEMFNAAVADIRRDPSARFCGYDNEGHCLILEQTQQSVAAVWQKTVAYRQEAEAVPAE